MTMCEHVALYRINRSKDLYIEYLVLTYGKYGRYADVILYLDICVL